MNRAIDIPNAKPGFARWLIVLHEVSKRTESTLSYSDKKNKQPSINNSLVKA